ncbi:T9SS type A sorting domain-containing protein [Mucilaginibacter sp. HMF5004]|uniref:T9SS type A sorting domain-containing protein n=1 Tax=Mucilaginibacter rivuli TaxID=2857527 RepID=UPI001C5DF18E|nr:T9SS type A sorting domain-containing protein [Mucilaginibacter rivuli]MBW4890813.1 T9SS type A sorting domain-containing protein [Mucilaginibacter rivuli]
MRKAYYKYSFVILIALASLLNYALAGDKKTAPKDTARITKVFTNKNDKSYLKNGLHVSLPPLKPAITIYGTNTNTGTITKPSFPKFDPNKLMSNVQVYPSPITDQINLRYNVAKSSTVTIKIMDILGNDMITLFSQHVEQGEQKFTFNLNNKLSSGFYFVRLVIGNETVIKRITIL